MKGKEGRWKKWKKKKKVDGRKRVEQLVVKVVCGVGFIVKGKLGFGPEDISLKPEGNKTLALTEM